MPYLLVFLALLFVLPSAAQPQPRTSFELNGPRELKAGTFAHYYVSTHPSSARPVRYRWQMGDGRSLVGNVVTHCYAEPGTYEIVAVTTARRGVDTVSTAVTVRPDRFATQPPCEPEYEMPVLAREEFAISPETPQAQVRPASTRPEPATPKPAALAGPPAPAAEATDGAPRFTWMLETHLDRFQAELAIRRLIVEGLRPRLMMDTTRTGSPAYRVVLGAYRTEADAHTARRYLPDAARPVMLVGLIPLTPVAD